MIRQVMHGTRYIDEVVLEVLEEGVAFVHQDANWNVKVLTDFAGQVLERYDQTPYGIITVDQETMFGDGDGDGFIKVADWDTNTNGSLDSGDTCWGNNPTGDCRLVDFDFDGDVDATDATTLTNLASDDTYRRPGLAYSVTIGNRRSHQGLVHDVESETNQNRNRQYLPAQRVFAQRDPLGRKPVAGSGYQDGLNLFNYVGSNPNSHRDPLGLWRGTYTCTVVPATGTSFFFCVTICTVTCILTNCASPGIPCPPVLDVSYTLVAFCGPCKPCTTAPTGGNICWGAAAGDEHCAGIQ